MTRTEPVRAREAIRRLSVPGGQTCAVKVRHLCRRRLGMGADEFDSSLRSSGYPSKGLLAVRGSGHQTFAGYSFAPSRIGNRQRNVNVPFSPVPPPLPGGASFPTPHTQQVVHGGLGSKEEVVGQGKTEEEEKKFMS